MALVGSSNEKLSELVQLIAGDETPPASLMGGLSQAVVAVGRAIHDAESRPGREALRNYLMNLRMGVATIRDAVKNPVFVRSSHAWAIEGKEGEAVADAAMDDLEANRAVWRVMGDFEERLDRMLDFVPKGAGAGKPGPTITGSKPRSS